VTENNEAMLVSRAAGGDAEAFGELYQRYVNAIYTYIYYRTGSTVEAEDLTARVFLRALRSVSAYRDRGVPFSAWLYRIAHNLTANFYRDASRRQEIPLDEGYMDPRGGNHPETELLRDEQRQRLLAAIRTLPAERQQLVILKFVERLSNAEIGQIIGRSESAVKSLFHRTLLALRAELEAAGFSLDEESAGLLHERTLSE
jgi:RNA polymerase sigma-70 factor (ECF subfamily)